MPEANGKALAAGRAELDTIFASAPIFYLDHDGDWVRGTITAVDSVTTEYGTSPQIEFTLINGESFKSGPATPGTLWRVARVPAGSWGVPMMGSPHDGGGRHRSACAVVWRARQGPS
jgi:hypothetical protein